MTASSSDDPRTPAAGRRAMCAVCHLEFETLHSTALPFCSPRCKQIDLGRWLNEGYSVPVDPTEEQPDEQADR